MTPTSSQDRRRQPYLDGLRGCAALMVLIAHLAMMVWPGIITTEVYPPDTPGWQLAMAASPLSILWDGRLAVAIFFILSGYVLTAATLARPISLPALIAKRYVRLALPVLAATLPTLLLLPAGWYLNHEVAYTTGSSWFNMVTATGFQPSFFHWLRTALWTVFFIDGHTSYNALLWTMQFEFYGSLLVFILAVMLGKPQWRLAAAVVLLIVLGEIPDYAILHLFLVGMILHDVVMLRSPSTLHRSSRLNDQILNGLGIALSAFGLYLPRLVMVLINARGSGFAGLVWLRQMLPSWQGDRWMLAAIPVVAGLLLSADLRRLLATPLCLFLGRISFPLYLFHLPIILSFGSWLFLTLLSRLDLTWAAWTTFILTGAAALLVAWAMTFLVEQPSLWVAARIGQLVDDYCPALLRRRSCASS